MMQLDSNPDKNDRSIPQLLREIVEMIRANQSHKRHAKYWQTVNVNRMARCVYPFMSEEQIVQVVALGIRHKKFRPTFKRMRGGEDEPAVELV